MELEVDHALCISLCGHSYPNYLRKHTHFLKTYLYPGSGRGLAILLYRSSHINPLTN